MFRIPYLALKGMLHACNCASSQYLIYMHSIPSSPHEECEFFAKTLEDDQVHITRRFLFDDLFEYFSGKTKRNLWLRFTMYAESTSIFKNVTKSAKNSLL